MMSTHSESKLATLDCIKKYSFIATLFFITVVVLIQLSRFTTNDNKSIVNVLPSSAKQYKRSLRNIDNNNDAIHSLTRYRDCSLPSDNELKNMHTIKSGVKWFQTYWEPCISCSDEERIGVIGDGGKWICNPQHMLKHDDCIILSVGSNNEFGFEYEMINRFGCNVHVFDHTSQPPVPTAATRQQCDSDCLSKLHFYRYGLDLYTNTSMSMLSLTDMVLIATGAATLTSNDNATHTNTVVTQTNIAHTNIHTTNTHTNTNNNNNTTAHTMVDVFKIDCEGCEYIALNSHINHKILSHYIKQMSIEIHWGPAFSATTASLYTLWAKLSGSAKFQPFHKVRLTIYIHI